MSNSNDGISAVVLSKNRTERLRETLPTTLANPEVKQLVLVDWSSDTAVHEDLEIHDERILHLRVEGEELFSRAQGVNLGARFCSEDYLTAIDADWRLDKDFFKAHVAQKDVVFHVDPRKVRDANELGISGFFLMHKEVFQTVNGFNERLKGWGWEDEDLMERIRASDFTLKMINPDLIYHVPHDDSLRTEEGQFSDKFINRAKNICIAQRHPWSQKDTQSEYSTTKSNEKLVFCRRIAEPYPAYLEAQRECMISNYACYVRSDIRRLVVESGGTLWGYSFDELLAMKYDSAKEKNSPFHYALWCIKEELRELWHILKSKLSIASNEAEH